MHPWVIIPSDSRFLINFFKNYLESLGAKIPTSEKTEPSATGAENKQGECPFKEGKKTEMPKPAAPEEPELLESDVELDNTGVIGMSC